MINRQTTRDHENHENHENARHTVYTLMGRQLSRKCNSPGALVKKEKSFKAYFLRIVT